MDPILCCNRGRGFLGASNFVKHRVMGINKVTGTPETLTTNIIQKVCKSVANMDSSVQVLLARSFFPATTPLVLFTIRTAKCIATFTMYTLVT